jgi:2-polyprenyl-6-methoxyphenol hydroxylase-like FAD-dependent oxidoreductase
VNRINNGEINVCGLFRSRPGEAPSDRGINQLRGAPGSSLHERLKNATFDERSFSSVAGLSLTRHRASDADELRLGDALTMIPPVTGNGMSMAFESAELALAPLESYSRGELSWQRARGTIAHACDAAFAQRLRWAHWLQHLMFSSLFRSSPGGWMLRSNSLWQLFFSRTR